MWRGAATLFSDSSHPFHTSMIPRGFSSLNLALYTREATACLPAHPTDCSSRCSLNHQAGDLLLLAAGDVGLVNRTLDRVRRYIAADLKVLTTVDLTAHSRSLG